jgi:PAS domain S-box-containing protein
MLNENGKSPLQAAGDVAGQGDHTDSLARYRQFEKRQNELWRLTFLILFVLGAAFAWTSWASIRSLAHRFEALPVGLVVLVVLFGIYIWKRTQEISELRGLMRGLEQSSSTPPSDKQLDHLFEIIARSQQGYRDLIDSFEDVLLALDMDGMIRAVNRSFADLVDTPFQQIIGKSLTQFMEEASGEGADLLKRALPRFMERRQWSGVVPIRLKARTGLFYFDCVAHAMTRADKIHGMTVLARDVTALRKNETRFTELFEALQEGIYITTNEGNIVDVNPALVRILGYSSKEELAKMEVAELFPDPSQREIITRELDQYSVSSGHEIKLLRKDGTSVVCLNSVSAVRDNGGRILRYQGSLVDVTERHEIERRLHQQQEFARRLVDSFPDLIMVVDTEGKYTFVSPRSADVLGYGVEEFGGFEFSSRLHSEDLQGAMELFKGILSGKETFASLEVRVRHRQGDWRRIRFNFSALCDERGNIEGVVLSGRDVTDIKRLEEQLIQAEKLAAMGQMLAGVAHELNNPLTAILGVTELLRERAGVEDSTKRQLELTHRQARRAARIVQNLLEFSRPASPQKKLLDLNEIIERTLQLHEHSLRRNAIEVDFRPVPDLPGITGDANQLIQILLNLVTNAEHAIREVRESGRIQIRLGRRENRIAITIQDDGVGIRPEALQHIFDPFYTTKRPGGGTGLGLSICMSIIREHGGNIEAEVLPGGGSAFTVYLPFMVSDSSMGNTAENGAGRTDAENDPADFFKGRTVLVLDDEESILMLLQEGLSAQGLAVDCVATMAEAVSIIKKRNYDAVLCDLNLGTGGSAGNGRDASQQILAASGIHKPVMIYMTGDLVESIQDLGGPEGVLFLQKPFRISEVIALLKNILPERITEPNLK